MRDDFAICGAGCGILQFAVPGARSRSLRPIAPHRKLQNCTPGTSFPPPLIVDCQSVK